jgi:hypothetical protein
MMRYTDLKITQNKRKYQDGYKRRTLVLAITHIGAAGSRAAEKRLKAELDPRILNVSNRGWLK